MSRKDKLTYIKDFAKGKDPEIHPMFLKPAKILFRYPATPELRFDDPKDGEKSYNEEEVAQLRKKYFLVILNILKTPEEVELAHDWDEKEKVKNETIPVRADVCEDTGLWEKSSNPSGI